MKTVSTKVQTISICHVWDFHDQEAFSFRLPSGNIDGFVVDGDKVALHITPKLIVWDRETQVSRELELEGLLTICFNCATTCFFAIQSKPSCNVNGKRDAMLKGFTITEYSIGRTDITQIQPPVHTPHDYHFHEFGVPHSQPKPSPTTIMCITRYWNTGLPATSTDQQIFFDLNSGISRSSIWTKQIDSSTPYCKMCEVPSRFVPMSEDIFYYVDYVSMRDDTKLWVYDLNSPFSHRLSESSEIERERFHCEDTALQHQYLAGDDQFICLARGGTVRVFCFDGDVFMKGEVSSYREIRNQKAEERADQRMHEAQELLNRHEG
jgi:hypothetical protein